MKRILSFLLLLLTTGAFAQNKVPVGGSPKDTAYARGALLVDGVLRLPLYKATGDTTLLAIDEAGRVYRITKAAISNWGGGEGGPAYAEGYAIRIQGGVIRVDTLYVPSRTWVQSYVSGQFAAYTPTWNAIDGKPATFPPALHQHAITDVQGLQLAIDGTAAKQNLLDTAFKLRQDVNKALQAIADSSSAQRALSTINFNSNRAAIDTGKYVPLVVMWGESNIFAQYSLNSALPSSALLPRPAVQIVNNTTGAIEPLQIGVNNALDHYGLTGSSYPTTRHGWENAIASSVESGMWGTNVKTVYLVKRGQGGSKISEWLPGGVYFQKLTDGINTAIAAIKAQGKTPQLYFLNTIGVNDRALGTPVASFQQDYIATVQRLRALYGNAPFFVPNFMRTGLADTFDYALNQVAERLPFFYRIPATDAQVAASDPQGYHWDAVGIDTIGRRMCRYMTQFVGTGNAYVLSQSRSLSAALPALPGPYTLVEDKTFDAVGDWLLLKNNAGNIAAIDTGKLRLKNVNTSSYALAAKSTTDAAQGFQYLPINRNDLLRITVYGVQVVSGTAQLQVNDGGTVNPQFYRLTNGTNVIYTRMGNYSNRAIVLNFPPATLGEYTCTRIKIERQRAYNDTLNLFNYPGDAVTTTTTTDGNLYASRGYVDTANAAQDAVIASKAPTASPTFTGSVTAPTFVGSLSGNATTASTVATIAGKLTNGPNVTISGAGTSADPYVIGATSSGGGGTFDTTGYGLATRPMLRDSASALWAALAMYLKTSDTSGMLANLYGLLNGKAPISSPTFTGLVTAPALTAGSITLQGPGGSGSSFVDFFMRETASGSNRGWLHSYRESGNAYKLYYYSGSAFVDVLTFGTDASAAFGGNLTAPNLNISNWNTAFGWGNHAAAGYLNGSSSLNAANLTGTVAIANGGTGATSAPAARSNLGLGTAAALDVAASGDAASGQVVKGNDTRLSDSRAPTPHVHSAADLISGTIPPGRVAGSQTDGYIVKLVGGVPTWAVDATGSGGGSGTPGGGTGAVQYNNGTGFAGTSNVTVQAEGYLNVSSLASGASVTTPTAGTTLHGFKTGSAEGLSMYSASRSRSVPVQSSLAYKEWGSMASGMSSSGGLISSGGLFGLSNATWAPTGTADASTQYSAAMSATFPANRPRTRRKTGTTTNTSAGFNQNYGVLSLGTTAYGSGFQYVNRFAIGATGSGMRVAASTNFISLISANPSAGTNFIGLCKDAGDANLQLMYNDGSGTATKVDLGVAPSTTVIYGLAVWCKSGDTKYSVQIWTEDASAGRTVLYDGDLTTNIPAGNILQAPQCMLSNGTGTTDCFLDFISAYAEMD